ncbi:MAG: Npun_F0813 family protein [Nodosilinea sp.]
MFILKRQDVEIKKIKHPHREQQVLILSYQEQLFTLLSVFPVSQEDKARSFWRDLTDNQGKICVLLEEPDRFSVWGKLRLDQLIASNRNQAPASPNLAQDLYIHACLLLLQTVYMDVEDLLGPKQAKKFATNIHRILTDWNFPLADNPQIMRILLQANPLELPQLPPWRENHLHRLLEELHRTGKEYFGNTDFAGRAMEAIVEFSHHDQEQIRNWLRKSRPGQLWLEAAV